MGLCQLHPISNFLGALSWRSRAFTGGPAIGKEFIEVFGWVDAGGGRDIEEVPEANDPFAPDIAEGNGLFTKADDRPYLVHRGMSQPRLCGRWRCRAEPATSRLADSEQAERSVAPA